MGHEKTWLTVRGESDVQWGQIRGKYRIVGGSDVGVVATEAGEIGFVFARDLVG